MSANAYKMKTEGGIWTLYVNKIGTFLFSTICEYHVYDFN